jgi:hypothetical protein
MTDYTYHATFALSDEPTPDLLESSRRVWLNDTLIFDQATAPEGWTGADAAYAALFLLPATEEPTNES